MDPKKLEKAAKPKTLGDYLAARASSASHEHSMDDMEGMAHGAETVRQETYKGHRFTIRTTYIIEVDGKPLHVPLMVGQDGQVHCHSLPNYRFNSAVDMIKVLIDTFPDDFSPVKAKAKGAKPSTGAKTPKRRKKP